ncbi:uncharacterized protein podxl2 [Antennarius striatus]|uniref:uncharacterized protein podxl2 n=1 Tax=Antennarius striatus TaxID=241820 RepID=UPI0035B19F30
MNPAGMFHITLIVALLDCCHIFRLGLSQHVILLSPPLTHLQDEGPAQPNFTQDIAEMDSTKTSPLSLLSANQNTAMDENLDVIEESKSFVNLVVDMGHYRVHKDITNPRKKLFSGQRADHTSLEDSNPYEMDSKDRHRTEDEGENNLESKTRKSSGKRGGHVRGEEEEKGGELNDGLVDNRSTPDLEGLIVNRRNEEVEELWGRAEEKKTRNRHIILFTKDPSTNNISRGWMKKTMSLPAQISEVTAVGIPETLLSNINEMNEVQQVMCIDWIDLTGQGFVVLKMTQNFICEEFCNNQGVQLLKILSQVFARRMNSRAGSWVLYLSKPTLHRQLLINVASEHGVINTNYVLSMLGNIRTRLHKMGIQNYSAASSCHSGPSQIRSDYSKLFVVLVIIGSLCMVIITSGSIYICWQRQLPATKTMFRAEELQFVENGCHDNPILDVANDSQPMLQQNNPSGLIGERQGGQEGTNCWQAFYNEAAIENEEEEQDTHL